MYRTNKRTLTDSEKIPHWHFAKDNLELVEVLLQRSGNSIAHKAGPRINEETRLLVIGTMDSDSMDAFALVTAQIEGVNIGRVYVAEDVRQQGLAKILLKEITREFLGSILTGQIADQTGAIEKIAKELAAEKINPKKNIWRLDQRKN